MILRAMVSLVLVMSLGACLEQEQEESSEGGTSLEVTSPIFANPSYTYEEGCEDLRSTEEISVILDFSLSDEIYDPRAIDPTDPTSYNFSLDVEFCASDGEIIPFTLYYKRLSRQVWSYRAYVDGSYFEAASIPYEITLGRQEIFFSEETQEILPRDTPSLIWFFDQEIIITHLGSTLSSETSSFSEISHDGCC